MTKQKKAIIVIVVGVVLSIVTGILLFKAVDDYATTEGMGEYLSQKGALGYRAKATIEEMADEEWGHVTRRFFLLFAPSLAVLTGGIVWAVKIKKAEGLDLPEQQPMSIPETKEENQE